MRTLRTLALVASSFVLLTSSCDKESDDIGRRWEDYIEFTVDGETLTGRAQSGEFYLGYNEINQDSLSLFGCGSYGESEAGLNFSTSLLIPGPARHVVAGDYFSCSARADTCSDNAIVCGGLDCPVFTLGLDRTLSPVAYNGFVQVSITSGSSRPGERITGTIAGTLYRDSVPSESIVVSDGRFSLTMEE